jgi:alpha-tubulin suppressor-like RCC1 family protein
VNHSKVPLSIPAKITAISTGDQFILFHTADGRIYFQGVLYDSAEPNGKPRYSAAKPTLLPISNVAKVISGSNEILFSTKNRDLYVMGANNWNQLGMKHTNFVAKPTRLISQVRSAAIFQGSTVVISDNGIYVCGLNVNAAEKRMDLQRIADSGNNHHVFVANGVFYLPTSDGGWEIHWGGRYAHIASLNRPYFLPYDRLQAYDLYGLSL